MCEYETLKLRTLYCVPAAAGAIPALVGIVRGVSSVGKEAAVRAIWSLAISPEARPILLETGGTAALVAMLQSSSPSLQVGFCSLEISWVCFHSISLVKNLRN